MKLSEKEAAFIVEMLEVMKFFPASAGARGMLANEIQDMCESLQAGKWLAQRMMHLYTDWPGAVELRAVYCSKFRPRDGIDGRTSTATFPDGIPSERIEAPEPDYKQLPASPLISELIGEAVAAVREVKLVELPRIIPKHTPVPTAEDIAEVLRKQRENQAKRDEWICPGQLARKS